MAPASCLHSTVTRIDLTVCQMALVVMASNTGSFLLAENANGTGDPVATLVIAGDVSLTEDVSKVTDPDLLLDSLAKGPLRSLMLLTGGGSIPQPFTPLQPWSIRLWEAHFLTDQVLDPRTRRLIELGEPAAARVHRQLQTMTSKDPIAAHLAIVLRSVGTTESIPLLISLLEPAPKAEGTPGDGMQSSITELAVTSALWKLTGRKHIYTHKQWNQWWQSVKPDFILPADREKPEFQKLVTADRVNTLIKELETNEVGARETLIALGPATLPSLRAALFRLKPATLPSDGTGADDQRLLQAVRLAWVLDELGATEKIPAHVRREYFKARFSETGALLQSQPIEEDAACRALSHCSFADFCTIAIASDRVIANQFTIRSWLLSHSYVIRRRLASEPLLEWGDPTGFPLWNQVSPAKSPQAELEAAIPILIEGFEDRERGTKACAISLANMVGMFCKDAPERLIVALRDHWLTEADANLRLDIGLAMARFSTPLVLEAISQGLHSDRIEIVSDAAALVDWVKIEVNDKTRPDFARLVELTHHQNDQLRRRAVRSLRGKGPELLAPELDRLVDDAVDEIRKECAYAVRNLGDPQFADVLFKLADDRNEQVRIEAFSSMRNLHDLASMKRLLPYLRDTKIHGYAVSALARMGGKDSLPLLFGELQSGNDVGGMIYQHLRLLTGEPLEEKPEPWLAWWKANKPAEK